jgi:hypothetical protein
LTTGVEAIGPMDSGSMAMNGCRLLQLLKPLALRLAVTLAAELALPAVS